MNTKNKSKIGLTLVSGIVCEPFDLPDVAGEWLVVEMEP